MGIEQGIIQFVQVGLDDPSIAGGFIVQLPPNAIGPATPKAWTYRTILNTPSYVLEGEDPLTNAQVQVDAHGNTMADAIALASSIRALLDGYSGTLDGGIAVSRIFRLPTCVDGFTDANRSYVRTLEFEIHYYETSSPSGDGFGDASFNQVRFGQ